MLHNSKTSGHQYVFSFIAVYTGSLSQTSVCAYINKEVLSLVIVVFPKHFSFQQTRIVSPKKVTRFFFRTVSCCMHDSVCPKKGLSCTIVKSSQNITIPSIQKPHKGSESHLFQVYILRQAENTLLPILLVAV